MRIIIVEDAETVAQLAADCFADQVRKKQDSVLGLATGSTPTATYQKLIALHREGLDFSKVTTFNLDEYVKLPTEDRNSYRSFMNDQLFHHVNIDLHRTHVPNGMAADLSRECQAYEERIDQSGGIDLQLLGIGRDGHIGFNEPGSSLAGRTQIRMLARETILDNARFFGSEDLVPKCAITMGVGTILDARRIVLLATGPAKAEAIQATVEGPVHSMVTASALQMHPHVTLILDAAASHLLERREYYLDSEKLRCSLGLGW